MNHHRVKKYEVEYLDSQGEFVSEQREFTEAHAMSEFTVLETDGISIIVAKRLIQKWQKQSDLQKVYRKYSIPFV